MKLKLLAPLLISFSLPLQAVESVVSRKFQGVADSLTEGYLRKGGAKAKESLAVLSFSSSKDLSKTKAGFAASEMLTHFFVQRPEFIVLERGMLNQLEQEQKFQSMSGDTATAVKIGKMAGAKLLVLGTIEKIGASYQINGRIVRTETGEILSTVFEELPAEMFEERAKSYMNLVPEKQTIGFYGGYEWRSKTKVKNSQASSGFGGSTSTVLPQAFPARFYGGGLRYYPHQHIVIDAGIFIIKTDDAAIQALNYYPPSSYSTWSDGFSGSDHFTRFYAAWTSFVGKKIRWEAGAGAVLYSLLLNPRNAFGKNEISIPGTHPFIRLGLEFRPQERIGFGLAVNQELTPAAAKYESGQTAYILSGFSIDPSLAFYF